MQRSGKSLIRGYLYGVDHDCVTARFFSRDGLIELEQTNLGMLMFRLDTGGESPRSVVVSLFFIAMVADNTSTTTRTMLRSIYSSTVTSAAVGWLRSGHDRWHKILHPLGFTSSVSSGATCLLTCVMRGHAYNLLKSEVYPLVVPKELYLEVDAGETGSETRYVYLLTTYSYHDGRESRPSVFVVVSHIGHGETLVNILRHKFRVSRFYYLNTQVSRARSLAGCVGCVRRIGWYSAPETKIGTVSYKTAQLTVVRLERFYIDIGSACEFV
uniref:Capsid triplex subunit 1 n=1 Tax=Lemniscomys rat herpesvirus TaxID=3141920 RepID=A0AAU7E145_9VIRU